MKNQAMQHAIAKAHTKAEENKKGDTLTLTHNKRASDADAAQKPAAANVPEADKVLTSAVQALHDSASNVSSIDADIPRIVIREGLRGEKLVFFVDTETPQGTIEMFDAGSGKAEKEVVKVLFYKQATGPIKDAKERDKVVAAAVKAFNFPRVILRERLVKENSKIQQDDSGKAEKVDLDSYKEKLIQAIVKAIREA